MAVVNSGLRGVSDQTNKRLQELQQGYNQSAAVQQAQQQLQQAQANKPGAYQPGQAVQQAQQQLQQIQASKPQGYSSKYEAQLDSILQQIQNPQQFKYEFNGDNLFKSYQDLYTQQGRQASLDAQGQAAALTGGYGNSYGQIVGQQQYQQNLLDLYNVGLDLRDRAYQQYVNDQNNQKDIYNILQAADEAQYGRYRDTVGDWQNERNYATDLYNTERNFDYGQQRDAMGDWENERDFLANQLNNERNFDYNAYMDMLNAAMNQANMENQDYWTGEEFTEGQRQFNENMAENQRQFNENLTENQRQFNESMAEKVRQYDASLAEDIRQADLSDKLQRDKLAEEVRQYDASLAEQIRQADLDEAYRQAQFNWQQETDARDYAQSVRENDQKYAYNYVMDILANGQMPSEAMLAAAGISYDDAMKLMAQIQQIAGGGTGGNNKGGSTATAAVGVNGNVTGYYVNDGKGNTKFVSADDEKAVANLKENVNGGKVTMNDSVVGLGATNVPAITPSFANAANTGVSAGQVKAVSTNKQAQKAKTQVANDKKNVTTDVKNKKNQTTK